MQVTDARQTRRGKISIYIDGEFACVLHPDVYASSALRIGRETSAEELSGLLSQSLEKQAREKALSLLSRRSYTSGMLYSKLLENVGAEAAAAAVARMQELGLLDDADYARRYAAECLNRKGYSLSRTKQALLAKGIDRDLAEDTLAALEYDPQPAIARIVRRKYLRCLGDEAGVKKTVAALARLGYQYADIRVVLGNLAEDENYYEDGV